MLTMPEQSKRLPAVARKEAGNIPHEVVIVEDSMLTSSTEALESSASSFQGRQGEASDGDSFPAVPGNH